MTEIFLLIQLLFTVYLNGLMTSLISFRGTSILFNRTITAAVNNSFIHDVTRIIHVQ